MKHLYEKLELFYLGKAADTGALTLLKNSDFTTHAAIIGMTGSGKTGLGVALIEEAMLDNIPTLIIDPKGDMGNLCYRSAAFEAADFVPWVGEAKAAETAQTWKKGIESWHQESERAARLKQVDVSLYTPGSNAGLSIDILSSLRAPSVAQMDESDLYASILSSTVASLLSLVDEATDAHAKSFGFLSALIDHLWRHEGSFDFAHLIGAMIVPPFERVGVLALEQFFNENERTRLANRFNSLIASPAFAPWLQGVALDFDSLLFDAKGNARCAIFNIAHLGDGERMFFVTLLLERFLGWMRNQSGSERLRAILYMDEIYGYFPPSANPPSKTPMLTLLKQARAFGVGIVLSTQNPVDLDYKGLSNIGTWLIGRLQTPQDIDRVIEGLSSQAPETAASLRQQLSTLPKRHFLLKSVHRGALELFETRWVLSYLKGPLSREEIRALAPHQERSAIAKPSVASSSKPPRTALEQLFENTAQGDLIPHLLIQAEVRTIDSAKAIDVTEAVELELALYEEEPIDLHQALRSHLHSRPSTQAPQEARYAPLPPDLLQADAPKRLSAQATDYLYNTYTLDRFVQKQLRLESEPLEPLERFTRRVREALSQRQSEAIKTLETRYQSRFDRLEEQSARAKERLAKEKLDLQTQTADTLISGAMALLGTFFGSRSTGKIATTISKGTRIAKERQDTLSAEAQIERLSADYEALMQEMEEAIETAKSDYNIDVYPIETRSLRPKKRDIRIVRIGILWKVA
ncbi:MAG: ATP-binding protein [Campylobacterales bacterium]|nr:ATP-binding protein [Campylobacterales bacterium]